MQYRTSPWINGQIPNNQLRPIWILINKSKAADSQKLMAKIMRLLCDLFKWTLAILWNWCIWMNGREHQQLWWSRTHHISSSQEKDIEMKEKWTVHFFFLLRFWFYNPCADTITSIANRHMHTHTNTPFVRTFSTGTDYAVRTKFVLWLMNTWIHSKR